MAQPNLAKMVTALQVITTELTLVPNLPVMDNNQQILAQLAQIHESNQQFRQEVRTMRAEFQQLRGDMQQLRGDMQAGFQRLDNRVDAVEVQMSVMDHNSQARLYNSDIHLNDSKLASLVNNQKQPIPNFPENLKAVTVLTANSLTPLLVACGLEVAGTVDEKKRRFTRYIGAKYPI